MRVVYVFVSDTVRPNSLLISKMVDSVLASSCDDVERAPDRLIIPRKLSRQLSRSIGRSLGGRLFEVHQVCSNVRVLTGSL